MEGNVSGAFTCGEFCFEYSPKSPVSKKGSLGRAEKKNYYSVIRVTEISTPIAQDRSGHSRRVFGWPKTFSECLNYLNNNMRVEWWVLVVAFSWCELLLLNFGAILLHIQVSEVTKKIFTSGLFILKRVQMAFYKLNTTQPDISLSDYKYSAGEIHRKILSLYGFKGNW